MYCRMYLASQPAEFYRLGSKHKHHLLLQKEEAKTV